MKLSSSVISALTFGASLVHSFSVQSTLPRFRQSLRQNRGMAAASKHEFDSILGEGSPYRDAAKNFSRKSSPVAIVRVPDGSPAATVTMTSSSAVTADIFGDDAGLDDDQFETNEATTEAISVENPLFNNEILKRQHEKKLMRQQRKASGGIIRYVKNPFLVIKGKDFSDITLTIIIPAVLSFVVLRKAGEIVGEKLEGIADNHYRQAAGDIAFHAGNTEKMDAIVKSCMKKTWFQGAQAYKGPELFKRVIENFCKNKRVSPVTVRTLSYLLSTMKITDNEAAEMFVELASEDLKGTQLPSTIIFYSEHILKDKKAKKQLKPVVERLTERFAGERELVEKLQSDMAESAYRDAIAAAGADQTKLTDGWKVLGLDKETATKIFEETKELGFLNFREMMDRGESLKQQQKEREREAYLERMRNMFDEDGNVVEEDEVEVETEEDVEDVVEEKEVLIRTKACTKCGSTIKVTDRDDEPFLLPHFVCPSCGAPKRFFRTIVE